MKIEPVAWISHLSDGDWVDKQKQFDAPTHTPLYAIPDTHCIVPKKPTPAMLAEGYKVFNDDYSPRYPENYWQAMIEAAGVDDGL